MKHVYKIVVDERYSKKFYYDIMEYADVIELIDKIIVPTKQSEDEEYWATHCRNCGAELS